MKKSREELKRICVCPNVQNISRDRGYIHEKDPNACYVVVILNWIMWFFLNYYSYLVLETYFKTHWLLKYIDCMISIQLGGKSFFLKILLDNLLFNHFPLLRISKWKHLWQLFEVLDFNWNVYLHFNNMGIQFELLCLIQCWLYHMILYIKQ